MLTTILVATDFSIAARRAVQRAAVLAKHGKGKLHILHALPERGFIDRLFHRDEIDHRAMVAGAERAMQLELEAIQAHPGAVQASTWMREGTAQNVIGEVATEIGATLVVIGAHGEHQSAQNARMLGGTALKVFARTSLPVLLVRSAVPGHYYKILAAADDSAEATAVLTAAAAMNGARSVCQALHVFDPPFAERLRTHQIKESMIGAYAERGLEHAEQALKRRLDLLDCARRITPIVVRGSAAHTILAEIREREPDLVVIGKRRRLPDATEEDDRYFGSVSLRVALESPTDVLLIP